MWQSKLQKKWMEKNSKNTKDVAEELPAYVWIVSIVLVDKTLIKKLFFIEKTHVHTRTYTYLIC